jgi:hypothetical protein
MEKAGKGQSGRPAGGGRTRRAGETKKEDWIGRQLRRVFDDSLGEPLPDDLLSLLEQIEDGSKAGER